MKFFIRSLLLASFLVFQCTISPTANTDKNEGNDTAQLGKVSMDVDMAAAPEEVVGLRGFVVSSANDTIRFDFKMEANAARALVENLTPGTWLLQVDALSAEDAVLYSGSTTVQVMAGVVTPVALQLNPVTGGLSIRVTWGERALSDSLVICYYPFEDNFNDLSAYQNNGTGYGGVAFDEGIRGQGLLFDGIDDYVEIPDGDQFDIEDKTITFWFYKANDYINPTPGWWDVEGLIYKSWDSGLNRDFSFNLRVQQPPFVLVSTVWDGSDSLTFAIGYDVISPKEWYLVTLVVENKKIKLYLNSDLIAVTPYSGSLIHNDAPVTMGKLAYNSASTRFFNGKIDDFVVLRKPLSSDQIQHIYKYGFSSLLSQLVN